MDDAPRPDAVVLRFTPMSAEGVLKRAGLDARRPEGKGHYTASVWADHAAEGETEADVVARLLAASELHGLAADNNRKYWMCSTAQKLFDQGFTFEKDDYPDEPREHYSVVLGDSPGIEDAQRFVGEFSKEVRE